MARQVTPEAPQVRLRALLFCGGGDRHDVVDARVERLRDAPDRAALARRVHAFHDDDDGVLLHLGRAAEQVELPLEHLDLLRVLGLGQALDEGQVLEDLRRVDRADDRVVRFGREFAGARRGSRGGLEAGAERGEHGLARRDRAIIGVGPLDDDISGGHVVDA